MASPKTADPPAAVPAPAGSPTPPPPSTSADNDTPAPDAAPMDTEASPATDLPPAPPAGEPATAGMEDAAPSAQPVKEEKETNGDVEVKDATPAPPSPSAAVTTTTAGNKRAASSAPEPIKEEEKEVETEEQRAEKRRKLEKVKAESKARGNRMFGVMLGTLKRAKAQVSTVNKTDAGRKRAEVDEKLQEKLGKERRDAMEKEGREREMKDLRWEVQRREEEIMAADAIYRTRHNAKLDLAGFLCTTFTIPPSSTKPTPSADTSDPHSSTSITIPPAFLPNLPHAMSLHTPTTTSSASSRPIYYLPRRLLPSQEDRIESQIDAVKSQMRKEREAWEEEKRDKRDEVERKRERLEELQGEVERREREERQRRRRAEEDRMEREEEESRRRERTQTREPSVAGMDLDRDHGRDGRSTSRAPLPVREERPEEVEGDVAMKEDKPTAPAPAPAELSINGAAAQKAAEEELEY